MARSSSLFTCSTPRYLSSRQSILSEIKYRKTLSWYELYRCSGLHVKSRPSPPSPRDHSGARECWGISVGSVGG
eukprot:1993945-Rhodomonas_salina.3